MAHRLAAKTCVPVVAAVATLLAPSATTEPSQITLGPGSAIAVVGTAPEPGQTVDAELCTLTAIGYDAAQRLVGITAGHCSVTGKLVFPENVADLGPVGRIVRVAHDMSLPMTGDTQHPWVEDIDFAIIEFDPGKVVPSATIHADGKEIPVSGLGGRPNVGDNVCKAGRTTGFTCGEVTAAQGDGHESALCADVGDSGAPVFYEDGRIVGLVTVVTKNPQTKDCSTERGSNIDDVLGGIGSGVGAGFRPFTG